MLKTTKEYHSIYCTSMSKLCRARDKVEDAPNFILRWWYNREYKNAIFEFNRACHNWLWAKHHLKNTKLGEAS